MMIRRSFLNTAGALAAALLLSGCLLLASGFQTVSLFFEVSEEIADGEARVVHAGFYPSAVTMKKYFVRISGTLTPAPGADLPSQVKVSVVNEDAASGAVSYRFNVTLRVRPDGSFEAVKRHARNLPANTAQTVTVEPVGASIARGSEVSLCVDVAKKKSGFGPTCALPGPGSTGDVVVVRVLDNAFEPKSITIQPGQTVRWVLEGSDPNHTTTEMNATWDSGFVFNAAGNFYERTFPESENGETFMYSCVTHKDCCTMQGSVRVGEGAPEPDTDY